MPGLPHLSWSGSNPEPGLNRAERSEVGQMLGFIPPALLPGGWGASVRRSARSGGLSKVKVLPPQSGPRAAGCAPLRTTSRAAPLQEAAGPGRRPPTATPSFALQALTHRAGLFGPRQLSKAQAASPELAPAGS